MATKDPHTQPEPPDWANRFLEWYCAEDLLDEIQGDLLEIYEHRVEERGLRKANWLFIKEVLLFFRPSSFKKKNPFENLPIMLSLFKSYFKTAARNIWKTKVFSGLNLIGLTAGFTSFLFIALYIQYESSFDQYHEKSDRIYRVAQVQKGNTYKGTDRFALAPSGLGAGLTENFPEVEAATLLNIEETLFTKGDRTFYEKGLYSDEFLFDVFSFEILAGNGPESLKNPAAILITESFAKKYFGDENPIGEVLELEQQGPLTVEGIVKDPPNNSHFTFSYISSIKNLFFYRPNDWNNSSFYAYTALKEGYSQQALEDKLIALDRKYLKPKDDQPITESKFFLQPLTDIHLRSRLNFEIGKNGDIRYLYFFASIAFIILLIAAINYLNFAIADSERRATEVGMRKALGARRGQLVQQFLGESLFLTLISFFLANVLVFLLLPQFNNYLGQEITFDFGAQWKLWAGLVLIAILIGIGAGLYPAFFISRVAPMKALKGNIIGMYQKSNWLRNVSVTGQFMAAIVLAIGSLVILQQLEYVQDKRLGYNEDQVLFIPYTKSETFKQSSVIKTSLLENPHIKKVSFSFSVPTNISQSRRINNWEGSSEGENLLLYQSFIDYDFMDLYDMEIIAGRGFSTDFPADSLKQYILNETAVKSLGWNDNAIGKAFQEGKVVGIVKDFHFQPLHLAIEPLFLELATKGGLMSLRGNISLKVDGENMESTINYMQSTMKSIVPAVPFEYQFLDEALSQMYLKERRLGRMFRVFTGLAVLISILGLLGLAAYNVVRRSKEISIRKVLGASASSIVSMLFKDYLKLILFSLCIATPVAYYLMQRWLESFAYRITLAWQWQIFLIIGLAALILPLLLIGLQSVRSALANPVDNLRS